ncbi:EamA/RhaT family transporter [candidate division TA06 bacterium]|uniref:EamA/RhaT family transporter n=1 Tax=candidate division TA06 bacterium TaxID=2250710 RepID=A0A660S947_UNCT6|nr:MAG: EamA/RhaT family transporter [candidate division TA06 bacterium]
MKRQNKAYILAVLSVLMWATVASAFKIALKYVNYMQLLLYASLTATLVTFVILLLQKKLSLLKSLTFRELRYSVLMGFINPFLYYMVLFKSYSLLPAQEAMSLNYSWPVMLVIFSAVFLKQKIDIKKILAITISFFGVIVIATKGNISSLHFSNSLGDILALSSSLIWAGFWILNLKDKRDETVKLFFSFLSGFVFILILNLITKNFVLISGKALIANIYVGLFEMGVTFVVWLYALKLSETTAQISNFIYFTPFLSLFIIALVIKEHIYFSTIVGLSLVIGGIVIQKYWH